MRGCTHSHTSTQAPSPLSNVFYSTSVHSPLLFFCQYYFYFLITHVCFHFRSLLLQTHTIHTLSTHTSHLHLHSQPHAPRLWTTFSPTSKLVWSGTFDSSYQELLMLTGENKNCYYYKLILHSSLYIQLSTDF